MDNFVRDDWQHCQKQEVLSAVLDGEGEGESLNVFDELINQLAKENER